jgi:D-cysteine desulfhydrase
MPVELGARRIPLALAPTPLQLASRLSEKAGIEVWLKREDLTGVGLGGNKVRALEYLLADAIDRGADCLVTGAGPQSNWAMLAALGARCRGLDAYLVLYGDPVAPTGNLLLDRLAGAHIRFTGSPDRASVDAVIDELTVELARGGRRPYPVPRGGATPLGALGYVRVSDELAEQMANRHRVPTTVWLATGSCVTQAGLVAGALRLDAPHRVVGVTVSRPAGECMRRIAHLATEATRLVAAGAACHGRAGCRDRLARDVPEEDVMVVDGYLDPGYGRRSAAGDNAARLVARTEGVLLDPVFGAKAMAALLDHAHDGRLVGPVVFLVTGGAPTLFLPTEAAL